jgi:hypothetical protein
MGTIYYHVDVDRKYKHLHGSFTWWLRSVLNTTKHQGITKISGVEYIQTHHRDEADICAKLVPQSVINKECGFEQLSCSIVTSNASEPDQILFSYENWMGGSQFKGNIRDYRRYIINHEFLHCRPFHLDHPDTAEIAKLCSTHAKLPVMYQQSRGTVGKCVHNPWPLAGKRTFNKAKTAAAPDTFRTQDFAEPFIHMRQSP